MDVAISATVKACMYYYLIIPFLYVFCILNAWYKVFTDIIFIKRGDWGTFEQNSEYIFSNLHKTFYSL